VVITEPTTTHAEHIYLSGEHLSNGLVRSGLLKITDINDPQLGVADEEMARLIHIGLSRYIGGLNSWRGATHGFCQTLAGIANLPSVDRAVLPPPPGIPLNGFSAGRRVMKANGLLPLELSDLWAEAVALNGDLATLPLDLVTQFVHPTLWPMFETSIRWGPHELAAWLRRYFLLAAQGKAPNCGQLSSGSIEARLTHCWRWKQTLKEVHGSCYRQQLTGDTRHALDQWDVVPKRIDVKTLNARPAKRDRTAPELEAVRRAYLELEQAIAEKRTSKQGRRTMFNALRDRALLHTFCMGARAETIASMRVDDVDLANNRIRLRELKGQRAHTAEGVWKSVHPKLTADLGEFIAYVGVDNSHGHTPLDQLDPDTYGADEAVSDYRNHKRKKALPLWVTGRLYFDEETGEPVPANDGPVANWSLVGRGIEARPDPRFPQANSLSLHVATILRPYTGGVDKTGHTLRHLAEQLAQDGARDHLKAHAEPAYITEEAIAAALLDHKMPGGIAAVYTDIESDRPRLARIAAHAITEYLTTDRGAQLGLDEQRIITSRRRLQETEAQLRAAQARIAELERELATLRTQEHPLYGKIRVLRDQKRVLRATAVNEGHSLPEREYRRLEQEIQQFDDQLEELRDELTAFQGRLAGELADENKLERHATARLHQAQEELRQATEARIPLPPGQEPGDLDQRLHELLGDIDQMDEEDVQDEEPGPLRNWLTVKEYAAVIGIPHSTMRRYIREASSPKAAFPSKAVQPTTATPGSSRSMRSSKATGRGRGASTSTRSTSATTHRARSLR
jgi:hypothetical protein